MVARSSPARTAGRRGATVASSHSALRFRSTPAGGPQTREGGQPNRKMRDPKRKPVKSWFLDNDQTKFSKLIFLHKTTCRVHLLERARTDNKPPPLRPTGLEGGLRLFSERIRTPSTPADRHTDTRGVRRVGSGRRPNEFGQ